MASQSGIAEGNPTVSSDSTNYQQKLFSHESYKFEPINPNTFGAPIVLGSSQIPVIFNLPAEPMGKSESFLTYTVNIPAGLNNTYTWRSLNAIPEISHIQLYCAAGMYLCDLDNAQNYCDIMIKKELSRDEFLSLDRDLTGVGHSNSLVNVVPALRNSNILAVNTPGGPANPSSVNYVEPAYFSVSGFNLPTVYNVQFRLGLLRDTIFAINKTLFYNQVSYLKIYFGPISKVCYSSDSNNNPSAGNKTSFVGLAGAAATITNLQLMLALESNTNQKLAIIEKVNTSGMTMFIPYVQSYKVSNLGAASNQNVTVQLDQTNGRTLLKAVYAPYNSLEDLDVAYDHANTPTVGGVSTAGTNQKIYSYYTQLNSKREQDLTLDCTSPAFTDYMSHKRQIRGSILQNRDIYQYNWFHCSDYSSFGSNYDQHNSNELISGIPMLAPLTWSFVGVSMRSLPLNHYMYFIFNKKLTIQGSTVLVE